ncbi:peroxisomal membrane protein 11A [Pyrus x bretschneideri]|uniref:peroxisomal membrane protein 11A n=1 Tax=Pyrus x bretschneideri TaxID=225117 RepID=UPI00202DDEC6|nr:peroxisomal membrane protein 11A [Pyrus x bretschneideri]
MASLPPRAQGLSIPHGPGPRAFPFPPASQRWSWSTFTRASVLEPVPRAKPHAGDALRVSISFYYISGRLRLFDSYEKYDSTFIFDFLIAFTSRLIFLKRSYQRHSRSLQKISAWAEFIGYAGSISLKFRDLNWVSDDDKCVKSSIEFAITGGNGCEEEKQRLSKLCEKKMMKRLSVVQDSADALMALADIRDGGGPFLGPLSVSLAGMLSALISTRKNWVSC